MISAATFDLECTALNADFGVVLCGVVKAPNQDPVVIRADKLNPRWDTKRSDDSDTVKAIVEELSKYDILVAHNGLNYDLPFLRTRMAKYGMDPLPDFKLVDPVQVARRKLKLSYNSLDKITEFLGINQKTTVDGTKWLEAALDGSREAMDYIVDHCVKDVLMLEQVVDTIKHYSPAFNSKGSFF